MIIYGVLSDVSIGKLFMAGILPGLLLASLYSFYIMVVAKLDPSVEPLHEDKYTWKDKRDSLKDLAPVFSLIAVVLGSIYGGYATPTEAAALGVLGSVILAIIYKSFSLDILKTALLNDIKTSVMILDGISIVVMTLPIVLPIVVLAGFDPLWFGIFLVFMVEMSQITPPVGFSLFIIQSISNEKIEYILKATFPFFLLMVVAVALITFFPEIVFYLPNLMIK